MDKKQIIAYLNFLKDDLTNKNEIIDYCISQIREEIEYNEKDNWIKLNKKASNLPKTDCYCWLRVKDDFGDYHILTGHYSDGGKHFYAVITATITHYQIIEKPTYPLT